MSGSSAVHASGSSAAEATGSEPSQGLIIRGGRKVQSARPLERVGCCSTCPVASCPVAQLLKYLCSLGTKH